MYKPSARGAAAERGAASTTGGTSRPRAGAGPSRDIYIYISFYLLYIYIYIWANDLPAPWCFLHTTYFTVHRILRAHKRPE